MIVVKEGLAARCPACRMQKRVCICALIPRVDNRTRVVVILHQLEARKPTNTGRLAVKALARSALVIRGRVAERGDEGTPALASAGDAGRAAGLWRDDEQPLLLYPAPDATPLGSWRAAPRPPVLLVPDGTWRQAAKTRRRLEELGEIPCVTLPPELSSRYRLRSDRRPGRLATLEAIAVALGVLEGPAVEEPLQRLFDAMVERTLWTSGRGRGPLADAVSGAGRSA